MLFVLQFFNKVITGLKGLILIFELNSPVESGMLIARQNVREIDAPRAGSVNIYSYEAK